MRVRDLVKIVDRLRRIDFRGPEEPSVAAHFVLRHEAIRYAASPVIETHCRISVLMADDHHALSARERIFHRREPTAQGGKLALRKFISSGVLVRYGYPRRRAPPQREAYNIRILDRVVHLAPNDRALQKQTPSHRPRKPVARLPARSCR